MNQSDGPSTTGHSGFPSFIVGLGPFKRDALNKCEVCAEPTSFSYGCHPLCCTHARQKVESTCQR